MSLGAWFEARLLGASLDCAVLAVLVWAAVRLLCLRPRLTALLWGGPRKGRLLRPFQRIRSRQERIGDRAGRIWRKIVV